MTFEESKYVRVDEFSDINAKVIKVEKEAKKVNKVINEDIGYNEKGQPMYYAEEVFDDEDDIYANELNDRLLEKSKYRPYPELGALIDEALLTRGFKGEFGLNLLASMRFSHFINLPYDVEDKLLSLVSKLFIKFLSFELKLLIK